MEDISVGFIGGGRVTGIILAGWKRSGQVTGRIVVSETVPASADIAVLFFRFLPGLFQKLPKPQPICPEIANQRFKEI